MRFGDKSRIKDAYSSASLVLPLPPTPVSVSSRLFDEMVMSSCRAFSLPIIRSRGSGRRPSRTACASFVDSVWGARLLLSFTGAVNRYPDPCTVLIALAPIFFRNVAICTATLFSCITRFGHTRFCNSSFETIRCLLSISASNRSIARLPIGTTDPQRQRRRSEGRSTKSRNATSVFCSGIGFALL